MIAANNEKLADDALRKSEEKYELIVNNIADTVTILDFQMNIVFVTPSIERLRGFTVEEVLTQNIQNILTPDSLKIAGDALMKELEAENMGTADPGRSIILELEEYRKDGSVIWVGNRISFIRDESGRPTSLLVISRDITARKEAEEKLREAKRQAEDANIAKSQFLAGMSHEIRTPLNAILGMTDLSLMTDNDDLIREYLAIVKRSGNHLLRILNDILDFSKIEAGNLLLEQREFPLRQIFSFIDKFYRIEIEKKGITFNIETSENLPGHIVGDEIRIRQMIMNLMSNAVKFTESGSIILSACRKENKTDPGFIPLEISVTDTGCGIDPDKHEMIFSKFQQAEMSTTRKFGGSGLGLSIVKELASLMKGDIIIESTPGKGSRFTLSILVEDPASNTENRIRTKTAEKPILPVRNLKILLAEDDEINIKLAVTLLKKLGDEVTVARNGIEALKALKNNSFDLVLMDIEMPEMDGIEATLKIREGYCGGDKSDIPIIAMTAHAVSDVKQRGLDAGMNDYITKP
ncbi:MAG: response regulator, partial [Clostridia bacterium]|nr:response regulator [Clostridia bacterium]